MKQITSIIWANIEKLPILQTTKQNQKIVIEIIALVDEFLTFKTKDSTFDTSTKKLESHTDEEIFISNMLQYRHKR